MTGQRVQALFHALDAQLNASRHDPVI